MFFPLRVYYMQGVSVSRTPILQPPSLPAHPSLDAKVRTKRLAVSPLVKDNVSPLVLDLAD